MLKRKIEQKLIDWKNTENRKPLIIKGCRQCGKTFSVLDFAKKNYKHVVYLNFFSINLKTIVNISINSRYNTPAITNGITETCLDTAVFAT